MYDRKSLVRDRELTDTRIDRLALFGLLTGMTGSDKVFHIFSYPWPVVLVTSSSQGLFGTWVVLVV